MSGLFQRTRLPSVALYFFRVVVTSRCSLVCRHFTGKDNDSAVCLLSPIAVEELLVLFQRGLDEQCPRVDREAAESVESV